MPFLQEIWSEYSSFLKRVLPDFLKTATVWVLLYLFAALAKLLPVEGWAGAFILDIHKVGGVAIIVILVLYLVISIISSYFRRGG